MTTYVWKSASGVFVSSSNWSPSGVPGPGDSATISGGVLVTDPNSLTLATLVLGGNTSLTTSSGVEITSSLVINAGALLSDDSVSNSLTLDGVSGSIASGVVNSNGAIDADDPSLNVGNTGAAVLSVFAGGVVLAAEKLDIGINAGGSGTVLVSGGIVEYGTNLYVGNTSGGSGSITVNAAGFLIGTAPPGGTSGEALIGVNTGASGSVVVAGSGALFNTDGNPLVVGLAGEGSLVVSGGAHVETGSTIPNPGNVYPAFAVGDHSGGVGFATIEGAGSLLSANGFVGIGRNGAGSLVVTNSGTLIGGDTQDSVQIGDANATGATGQDTGTAFVNNGGTLSAVGTLLVGTYGGSGTLFVSAGGSVLADGQVGIGDGNTTYGPGSGAVTIGPGGDLQAGVAPSAVPTGSSGIFLGGYAGATGSLTVSGPGALVTANGTRINVANKGNGSLSVLGGGTVLAGSTGTSYPAFQVGQSAGTSGSVTVSGSGSVISAAGEVIVGLAGSGSLVVSGGGAFLAGSTNSAVSTGFVIGETSGTGQVTVAGSAAMVSAVGGMQVGDGGTGGLAIVSGGTVDADTVTVGSGAASGILSLSAATAAPATLDVSGLLTVSSGGSVVGSGTVSAAGTVILGNYDAGGQILGGTVVDDGLIDPTSTLAIAPNLDGTGAVDIGSGVTVVVEHAADTATGDALDIGFAGVGGTLDIKDLAAFDAVVSGYQTGDMIAVYGATAPPSYSASGNDTLLTFQGVGTLALAGLYASGSVNVEDDPNPACYAAGTLIATPQGERQVEDLRIGDAVLTASGQVRTVRWVGHRSYAGRFLARNPAVRPIRIAAGALGQALPRRDLIVSPNHAMLLDGVLVPARLLLNGLSITQLTAVTEIDYRHIELDTHDVILAEGAASETFVDDGSRGAFHNAHTFAASLPGDMWADPLYCAERVEHGDQLERIRNAIARVPAQAARAIQAAC